MASFRSILVPVVDRPSSLDAVAVAANLVQATRGRLFIVNVVEVDRSLPLDADVDDQAQHAEQTLRRALEQAGSLNGKVETDLLQARSAGRTIVDFAKEKKVEAILMGVSHQGVIGGFQLGATPQHVLTHAPCQVWVLRDTVETPS